jgi:hypothetical protein
MYQIIKFLDLGIGLLPICRVIINYAKWFLIWCTGICGAIGCFLEDVVFAHHFQRAVVASNLNGSSITEKWVWFITFVLIGCIIVKKCTIAKFIDNRAKKYVNEKIAANQPISEKEFLSMKSVDHCQRWNIKTNKEITFYFVQHTLEGIVREKINASLQNAEERIYLYKEYSIYTTYLEEKNIQMNTFLSDNYITVGDAGFFSQNIYSVLKGKISKVIESMPSIFSLQQAFESCADSQEMNQYLPQNTVVTVNEKNTLYSPVIHHEINDLKVSHQISEVPPTKEDAPVIYNKIQPGLVNENGIYTGEPNFGGAGCHDCGIHTMPDDDEEDEL